jgi:hypothetical protein
MHDSADLVAFIRVTLEYETPGPPTITRQDHIYTTLLAVLGFFLFIGVSSLIWQRQLPTTPVQLRPIFAYIAVVNGGFLVAIIFVFVVRLAFPDYRRWPTFGLNILLLIMLPFGTALAVYAFWKVDKKLPRAPE